MKYTTKELLTGKKLYFVTIRGELGECEEVCTIKAAHNGLAPAIGCDTLVYYRNGISSANSNDYAKTKKAALIAYINKQGDCVKQHQKRYKREKSYWEKAIDQLVQL